jgi:hypothetical protein
MKRNGLLLSLVFALLLAVPLLLILVLPERDFSPNENRYLTQAPALDGAGFLDHSLQPMLERWLEDQFPGRDGWMAAVTLVDKAAGQKEIGGAWLGKDGYYPEVHRPEDFDWTKYRRNLGYLRDLSAQAAVPTSALLVPSTAATLPELLPAGAEVYDPAEALDAARAILPEASVPDLSALLRADPKEQVYYRTDHHWTSAGMKRAYDSLPDSFGAYRGKAERFCTDFYGSTWSKTLDPTADPDEIWLFPVAETVAAQADGEAVPVYDLDAAARKDKYTVFLGGNHGLVSLTGGCQNGKTLLVLKDSFANCLAPLLTSDYETVLLVDLRYYPGSVRALLAQAEPDALLFVYEMSGLASGDDFVKLLL